MFELSAQAQKLEGLATALKYEEDGARRRREFAKELRTALLPAVEAAKAGIMAMGSAGLSQSGGSLRSAIASQIKAEAKLSGRVPGARVKAKKRRMPRGFANAPKRTNSEKGWRHPGLPADPENLAAATEWYQQIGKPGWFDDPMHRNKPRYRAAVVKVIDDMAARISKGA